MVALVLSVAACGDGATTVDADPFHCDGATEYQGELVRCEAGGVCVRKGDQSVCKTQCSTTDACAAEPPGSMYFTITLRDGSNVCYCDVPGSL